MKLSAKVRDNDLYAITTDARDTLEDHPFAGFTAEELEEMMTDPEAGDDGDESS
jgi:hypothetical protein